MSIIRPTYWPAGRWVTPTSPAACCWCPLRDPSRKRTKYRKCPVSHAEFRLGQLRPDLAVVGEHGRTVDRCELEFRDPHLVIERTAGQSAEEQTDQDPYLAQPAPGFEDADVHQAVVHPVPPRRCEPRRQVGGVTQEEQRGLQVVVVILD